MLTFLRKIRRSLIDSGTAIERVNIVLKLLNRELGYSDQIDRAMTDSCFHNLISYLYQVLTFLTKIRKSLIESGSARKYLLYAIGEILLVMIGILLALQVNNWNMTRQLKNVEKSALVQIRTNLNEEINYYEHTIERGVEIKTYLLHILSASYDSVDLEAFPIEMLAQFYWHVDFNSGYLELVSSNTLSTISNDEIRNEIVRFYGKHYDLLKTLAIEHREFVTTQIDKFVLENLLVDVERKTSRESMIEILDKTNFKSVLSQQIYYMDRFGLLHIDAIEKAKSIDALIESYLK